MNNITITGHIGRIDELKQGNNTQYINFTIADNQGKEKTNWFNVTAFGKIAELVKQYCTKGDKVTVFGQIELKTYDTKEGQKQNTHSVNIHAIDLPSRKEATQATSSTTNEQQPKEEKGDDLLF